MDWFCDEMGGLDVPDKHVDAFFGSTSKSVLDRCPIEYSQMTEGIL